MTAFRFMEPISWAATSGSAVTNTTPLTLLPSQAVYTIPANTLRIGSKLLLCAGGRISNIVTTPGTLTLDFRLGGTVVFNGGAMQLNAVAKTNVTWTLWMDMLVTAEGSAATILGTGEWTSESVVGSPLPSAGGS